MIYKSNRWLFGTILFCLLTLAGCVHYGQFRDDRPNDPKGAHKSIWLPEGNTKYYLAYIEVDDFGELFDRTQLNHAMTLIQTAKKSSASKNAIIVTFIHGWKNNASDDAGNVWGFREELNDIAKQYAPQPVVGVYIGWRGATTNLPVVKELTFYNRRNAAIRIPHAHLTEILERILHEAKSCMERCSEESAPGTGSVSIVVGHSFGGMVLERSLTQAVVGDILRQEEDRKAEMRKWNDRRQKGLESAESRPANTIRPPADLIAMVNEAAPATEAKQMLDLLKTHKMKLKVKISETEEREEPLFLSITSSGDAATSLLMPLGQYPSLLSKTMRKYPHPDPPEIPNQSTYYLHTTAHLPPLFSHLIGPEDDKNIAKAKDAAKPQDVRCFPSEELKRRYCIVPVQNRYNDTPYWVMSMPKEFVPDHSTIFRPVFRELLAQFIVSRMTPEGAKPAQIELAARQEELK
jgi:hypothetical protein